MLIPNMDRGMEEGCLGDEPLEKRSFNVTPAQLAFHMCLSPNVNECQSCFLQNLRKYHKVDIFSKSQRNLKKISRHRSGDFSSLSIK